MPMSRLEISAKSKLKSGLDKYLKGETKLNPTKLTPIELAQRTGEIPALAAQAAQSFKLNAQFSRLYDQTDKTMEKEISKVREKFESIGWLDGEREGHRIDTLGDRRGPMMQRDIARARKAVIAGTSDERAEGLVSNRELKQVITAAYKAWGSMEGVLMRRTIGDKDRDVYTRNLAQQGPMALEDAFFEAVRTDNPAMGAAIIQRMDSMGAESKKLVPFTKTDVAEHFLKVDFDKAHLAIKQLELNVRQAEILNRRIEGVRVNPVELIKIGVLQKELGIEPDAKPGEADPDAIPGETLEQALDRKYPGKPLPDGWIEYNADGSEMTVEQKEARGKGKITSAELRKADQIYWAAEDAEPGTGDAAVAAFQAGGE